MFCLLESCKILGSVKALASAYLNTAYLACWKPSTNYIIFTHVENFLNRFKEKKPEKETRESFERIFP
jgi:hypothetical protein